MASKTSNPAALANADRAQNSFNCLATLNGSENKQSPSKIKAQRVAWLARRFRISATSARNGAFRAFGGARS